MKANCLAIDFGNTLIKIGVFVNDELIEFYELKDLSAKRLKKIIAENKTQSAIVSSVTERSKPIEEEIKKIIPTIILSEKISIPVINLYKEKKKLGKDRLAGAVGGSKIFPKENVLVINCGTCIIYDFVNEKSEYLGGSISPGLEMRFNALHTFTSKLPKIKKTVPEKFIGSTTEESILSGVVFGASKEIDGMIDEYKKQFSGLKVIISGGDAPMFVPHLKNKIFAVPQIVLRGLYQILKFNAH
ncbi:type III pantothenate kinase [Bacteroidota bacterium]|nr:type III pantothenate kinase [Bacteroidota bacterium]